MKNKHNKKRNIGIIYELLLRHISSGFINENNTLIKKATNIIEKNFAKDTELYKEFRLFSGLARSEISSTEIAAVVLQEAKECARKINQKKLSKEKSNLIKEINYYIVPNDKNFYYRNIPEYIHYANIQQVINEWKKNDKSNFNNLILLEQKIIKFLLETKKKINIDDDLLELQQNNTDKLVYKLMTEKINKKYKNLTDSQKDILRGYAFSEQTPEKLSETLERHKLVCLEKIKLFKKENTNDYLSLQINEVYEKVNQLDSKNINDASIVKFLTIVNLINEISS
jgi:hypothetical protein